MPSAAESLDAGRLALQRAQLPSARRHFQAALDVQPSAEAYDGLAWVAWWEADAEALFERRAQAYRRYLRRDDRTAAAETAIWVSSDHLDFRGDAAVCNGWLRRARRLLGEQEPSAAHALLALHESSLLLFDEHDTAGTRAAAASATRLARRFGRQDIEAVGMATEGLALVTEGRLDEGFGLLDEAVATVTGGDIPNLWAIPWCCCYMIYACERVYDYGRAAQWCKEVEALNHRFPLAFAWGLCRAHHAAVLVWQGDWREAESEFRSARRMLERQRPHWVGESAVRLGELRRRQGRLDDAVELLRGVEGHPLATAVLAEVALDRGQLTQAKRLAERLLRTVPVTAKTERAAGLQLLVRAAAAGGNYDVAGAAQVELEALAATIRTASLQALASYCGGALSAARGEHDVSRRRFEDAVELYGRVGAPYEAARARLELAEALVAVGSRDDAEQQRRRATADLQALGVRVRPRGGAGRRGTLTAREREVLGLVARGMSDGRIAEVLVLSEHTVHRHVSNILTKFGCPSRAAAVARAVAQGELEPSTA